MGSQRRVCPTRSLLFWLWILWCLVKSKREFSWRCFYFRLDMLCLLYYYYAYIYFFTEYIGKNNCNFYNVFTYFWQMFDWKWREIFKNKSNLFWITLYIKSLDETDDKPLSNEFCYTRQNIWSNYWVPYEIVNLKTLIKHRFGVLAYHFC